MMDLPNPKDAIHKAWLYRILEAVADNHHLAQVLFFKGGTCASMLGWLDRFSVDLDFDYAGKASEITNVKTNLEALFHDLDLSIKNQSKRGIQYFLKYSNPRGESERSTLKIDVSFPLYTSSQYKAQRLIEIDRVLTCQTIETMFGHKLTAVMDRYEKTKAIAGRDIYDIHYFFLKGYRFNKHVIEERRGVATKKYLEQLIDFIQNNITEKTLTEDLNSLLTPKQFSLLRKVLKRETLDLLQTELKRFK